MELGDSFKMVQNENNQINFEEALKESQSSFEVFEVKCNPGLSFKYKKAPNPQASISEVIFKQI